MEYWIANIQEGSIRLIRFRFISSFQHYTTARSFRYETTIFFNGTVTKETENNSKPVEKVISNLSPSAEEAITKLWNDLYARSQELLKLEEPKILWRARPGGVIEKDVFVELNSSAQFVYDITYYYPYKTEHIEKVARNQESKWPEYSNSVEEAIEKLRNDTLGNFEEAKKQIP